MTRLLLITLITLSVGCSASAHSQEDKPTPERMVLEQEDVAFEGYFDEEPTCFAYSAKHDAFACKAYWHVNSGLETLAGVEWVSRSPEYQRRANKSWFREAKDVSIAFSRKPKHDRPRLEHSTDLASLEDINARLDAQEFTPLDSAPVFVEYRQWNTITPELEVRVTREDDDGMSVSIVQVRCGDETHDINFTYEGNVKAWVFKAPESKAMVVAIEEHESGHYHYAYAHLGEQKLCPALFESKP